MLISTPLLSVTAMLFEVLITCILGQITRAPGREACRLPFTNNPFDSEDLTPINLAKWILGSGQLTQKNMDR